MALIRTLLSELAEEANANERLAKELIRRLESKQIHIKLATALKDDGKTKRKFSERIEKTRLNRPDCLKILEEQEFLLQALDVASTHTQNEIHQASQISQSLEYYKYTNKITHKGETNMETIVGITHLGDAR